MADVLGWLRGRLRGHRWEPAAPIEGLSVAQVCDLLANDRRRWTLLIVDEAGIVELRQLSEDVAELEYGPRYTGKQRTSVYVALLQTHIPKLTGYGVLEQVGNHEYAPGPAFDGVHEALVELEYRVAGGNGEVIGDG